MGRKAAIISIDVNAGTAKMLVDLEKGKAGLRSFGSQGASSMHQFGAAGVTEHRAVSAAMKTVEGNFTNNRRAADAFLVMIPGLGKAVQAAFPVVGAIAFAGVIGEVGKKVYDFFKGMEEGPAKIANAFRSLNQAVHLSNDELLVSNDRLANDIAKLEGRRQNTLKLALDEARVAADKLAESLEKDLASINKLLKEQNVGWFKSWFGAAETSDIKKYIGGETGTGGFTGNIQSITARGEAAIANAATPEAQKAARAKMDSDLAAAYKQAQDWIETEIKKAEGLAHPAEFGIQSRGAAGLFGSQPRNEAARLAELQGLKTALADQAQFLALQSANTALTGKKTELETGAANSQLDKPFEDRMKALSAQLDGVKAKLAAIGQPEAAQVLAKAFGEAQKAIEEVNKALESHHVQLTDAQKGQIAAIEQSIASAEAEATWKTHLESTTTSINERIRSQELLTAAIGKGYEATKRANVETQVMGAMKEHYVDPAFTADAAKLRAGFGAAYDATHGEQVAGALEKLGNQIELEKQLAAVQAQGAEAVRQATLAHRIKQISEDNDAESAKVLIKAEIDLYNATRANVDAETLAKLNEKIAATQRLTDAVFAGAEAQRKAGLESKYTEMERGGASAGEVAAQRALDEAEHQHAITEEAGKLVTVYSDQVARLDQIEAALQKQKKDHGDTLEIEIALRDLENERLKIAVQQELKLKGAKDGLKAFFLEMQEDAKSAANIIYDTLNSALDKTSDQFAKLLTGQKTSFGKMFQSLGEETVKESTKSLMQKGLGKLGEMFGIHGLEAKPDGSTAAKALWVRLASASGSPTGTGGPSASFSNLPGLIKSGASGFGALLKSLFSSGGSAASDGLSEAVSSSITFMAGGGDVDPGGAYVVGEHEPEFFSPRTAGTITPASKIGGSSTTINHIDARGADLGAANRISRALEATHQSAVATAVRANAQRSWRVPQRAKA
jgi:hypothetical protein